ncbi:MAG: YceI family protein [Bacteroidetes bacterium]|nr:MAG: YceI family protein [Bacteroidota bacterium]
MRAVVVTLFSILCVCVAMMPCPTGAIFSTQSGQIKMTLALSIATSTGSNKQATSSIDTETHTVRFSMKIRDFAFDNYLVENAFEESYLEAGTYPEANFQGKLKTPISLKTKTPQKIEVVGDMTLHGVKKTKSFTANVTVISATQIKVTSDFMVKASDHKIDISPSMFANGRDEIKVQLNATYQKK